MMFLLLVLLFSNAVYSQLLEPKFVVTNSNKIFVNLQENIKPVVFRIGVLKNNSQLFYLETPVYVTGKKVFLEDQKLSVKKGDILKYLIAFVHRNDYQVYQGALKFNGVYLEKILDHDRREPSASTSVKIVGSDSKYNHDEEDKTVLDFEQGHYRYERSYERRAERLRIVCKYRYDRCRLRYGSVDPDLPSSTPPSADTNCIHEDHEDLVERDCCPCNRDGGSTTIPNIDRRMWN